MTTDKSMPQISDIAFGEGSQQLDPDSSFDDYEIMEELPRGGAGNSI